MKRLLTIFIFSLAVILTCPTVQSRTIRNTELPEDITKRLETAIQLVDGGMSEAALQDFNELLDIYPDNYLLNYEYAFALTRAGKYKEASKVMKELLKSPDVTDQIYQMYGVTLVYLGDQKGCVKAFRDGLKRFPDSGLLHCEMGLFYLSHKDYDNAFNEFEEGMCVEPNFAPNYFRCAQLLFASNNLVWPLIYAETSILLDPQRDDRHEVMASDMMAVFKDKISINADTVSIRLVPSRNIRIVSDDPVKASVDFAGIYEGCLGVGAMTLKSDTTAYTATIAQVAAIRKAAVEAYFNIAKGIYGNRMYLLDFQKKIIDAGHWEAYNYYLFGFGTEQAQNEFIVWCADEVNKEKLKAFIRWYNSNLFILDTSRTVAQPLVEKDMQSLSLSDIIFIMGGLITDTEGDDDKLDGE